MSTNNILYVKDGDTIGVVAEVEPRETKTLEEIKNLQRVCDFQKETIVEQAAVIKQQAAVIKQLVNGPGEVEYIHPLDLFDLINATTEDGVVDVYCHKGGAENLDSTITIVSTGKKYKQSIYIPKRTKNIV